MPGNIIGECLVTDTRNFSHLNTLNIEADTCTELFSW